MLRSELLQHCDVYSVQETRGLWDVRAGRGQTRGKQCDRRKLISTKLFGRKIQRQLGAAWRTDEKETEPIQESIAATLRCV